eukprot:425576_1
MSLLKWLKSKTSPNKSTTTSPSPKQLKLRVLSQDEIRSARIRRRKTNKTTTNASNTNTLNDIAITTSITKWFEPNQPTEDDNKYDKNNILNICYEESMLLSCGYIRNSFQIDKTTCEIIDCCASYLFGCIGFDLEAFIFSRINTQIGFKNEYYGFQVLSSYLTNTDGFHLENVNKLCYGVMKATKPVIDQIGTVISTPYIDLVDNKGGLVIDANGFTVCGGWKPLNICQLGLENIYIELIQKNRQFIFLY